MRLDFSIGPKKQVFLFSTSEDEDRADFRNVVFLILNDGCSPKIIQFESFSFCLITDKGTTAYVI